MRKALWEKVGRFSRLFSGLLTRLSNKRGVLETQSAHFFTIFAPSFPKFSPGVVKKAWHFLKTPKIYKNSGRGQPRGKTGGKTGQEPGILSWADFSNKSNRSTNEKEPHLLKRKPFFCLVRDPPNFPRYIPVIAPLSPPLTNWAKNPLMRAVFKRGKKRTFFGRFSAISWEQLSRGWLVKVKFILFSTSVFLASTSDFLTSWQELIILNLKALFGCTLVTNRFLLSRLNGGAGWVERCWVLFSIATRRDREQAKLRGVSLETNETSQRSFSSQRLALRG